MMTEINSHEHGMHPTVLIQFVHFTLKIYFIKKTVGVSDASYIIPTLHFPGIVLYNTDGYLLACLPDVRMLFPLRSAN
jgi:hypothetical protein